MVSCWSQEDTPKKYSEGDFALRKIKGEGVQIRLECYVICIYTLTQGQAIKIIPYVVGFNLMTPLITVLTTGISCILSCLFALKEAIPCEARQVQRDS